MRNFAESGTEYKRLGKPINVAKRTRHRRLWKTIIAHGLNGHVMKMKKIEAMHNRIRAVLQMIIEKM